MSSNFTVFETEGSPWQWCVVVERGRRSAGLRLAQYGASVGRNFRVRLAKVNIRRPSRARDGLRSQPVETGKRRRRPFSISASGWVELGSETALVLGFPRPRWAAICAGKRQS